MKAIAVILLAPLATTGCTTHGSGERPDAAYVAEVDSWHAERVASLRSETGWLTLAGLHALGPGEHTIGAESSCDIVIPEAPSPLLGTLLVAEHGFTFTPTTGAAVRVEGDNAPPLSGQVAVQSDAGGNPTVLTAGRVLFHVIERSGEHFLRVRDRQSPMLLGFDGIERYPVDPRWRVTATLIPEPGATLATTNVIGQTEITPCPGALEFDLEGHTHRLRPTLNSDGSLFFVFGDTTNGKGSYGSGRFLKADPVGKDGRVVLDFNKAYNPVCSFSPHATCPLPPPGNRLPIAIAAGERYRD